LAHAHPIGAWLLLGALLLPLASVVVFKVLTPMAVTDQRPLYVPLARRRRVLSQGPV
jgi:hypothetical protein